MKILTYIYNKNAMKAKMTINQALDKLLTKYHDTSKKPEAVSIIQTQLIELKIQYGGNTILEDDKEVLRLLK